VEPKKQKWSRNKLKTFIFSIFAACSLSIAPVCYLLGFGSNVNLLSVSAIIFIIIGAYALFSNNEKLETHIDIFLIIQMFALAILRAIFLKHLPLPAYAIEIVSPLSFALIWIDRLWWKLDKVREVRLWH